MKGSSFDMTVTECLFACKNRNNILAKEEHQRTLVKQQLTISVVVFLAEVMILLEHLGGATVDIL